MVTYTAIELAEILWPELVFLAIYGASGIVCRELSTQMGSRGLRLISWGFLIKTIIDGIWEIIYWVGFGGPFGIIDLTRNQSAAQAGLVWALLGFTGLGLGVVSTSVMVALIILGATTMARTSSTRSDRQASVS